MSRKPRMLLAIAGLAVSAGAAFATTSDALTVTQPVIDTNVEIIGRDTVFTVNVPDGEDEANTIVDGDDISLAILEGLDENGDTVTSFEVSSGLTVVAYDNATGTDVTLDLSGFAGTAYNTLFNDPDVVSIRIRVTTTGRNIATDGVQTTFDPADEAADTNADVDITPPTLNNVFVSDDGTSLFFVFSESLNNGDAANDDNHTDLAQVSGADFQADTSSSFDGTETAPGGLSNPAFLDANNSIVEFDFDDTDAAAPEVGDFIRPAYDAGGVVNNDIFDNAGTSASNSAAEVANLDDLEVVSAVFTSNTEVRVTFSSPLADVGAADDYTLTVNDEDGETDIVVTAVNADPDDSSSVLLTLDDSGDDQVGDDGLLDESDGDSTIGTFSVTVDADATSIEDQFGQTLASDDSATIGDEIVPTVAFFSYHDLNGDGITETAAVVFNEPVADTSSTAGSVLSINNVTVRPFQQIEADGTLVEDDIEIDAGEEEPAFTVSRVSVDTDADGEITARETNNAYALSANPQVIDFDGDELVGAADTEEAFPGTNDPNVWEIAYDADATGAPFADASGNAAGDLGSAAGIDRSNPVEFATIAITGDNTPDGDPLDDGDIDQCINEVDGEAGDQTFNNVIVFIASEAIQNNGVDLSAVQYGSSGDTFVNGDFAFGGPDNNAFIIGDIDDPAIAAGTAFTVLAEAGVGDNENNPFTTLASVATNGNSPYIILNVPVSGGGAYTSAITQDSDFDGFVDSIILSFTSDVDAATVQAADFDVNFNGTITGVDVSGDTVTLLLTDGIVPTGVTLTVTYNGSTDTTPIAGTNGNAVKAADQSFFAQAVPQPAFDAQDIALQDFIFNITTDGTTAVAPGGKLRAMVPVIRANRLLATHNNVPFDVVDSTSINSSTNFILGLRNFLYLHRDDSNNQTYRNTKTGTDSLTFDEVISINVNANNLTNITFTGTGETSTNKVTSGRVFTCWDVLRSDNGTLLDLFNDGFDVSGTPITSTAVITTTDGRAEIHVGAPLTVFNQRQRLNAQGQPLVFVFETAEGVRTPLSGLLSSINGAPILFNAHNRSQTTGTGGGLAFDATVVNVNLANVNTEELFGGWNTLPVPVQSGFANATSNRPLRPATVDESEIVVGTVLPVNPGALSQFVYAVDDNGDGMWTGSDDDDGLLDGVIVDFNCVPHFPFTMTSFGVQAGSAITNLVGGYAAGVFVNDFDDLLCFQFGAPISSTAIFPSGTFFPNNTTTQGWALVTNTTDYTPATIANFFTNNARSDFFFTFVNNGGGIEITSRASDGAATANINDATELSTQGIFVHFIPGTN